ncbi:Hsp20 family protein [Herbaspirillum sp. ST 5-3]|uniref:Hsp20/alpha crystallin family protein n=1 Tax=Oxalobacteraceae TaxID=75682 RepID=UPI0010A3BDCC|nr:Hsp20 family protein [Herbaspirillum sp. ST 5-3]
MARNLMHFDPFGEVARFEPFGRIGDFFKDFNLAPALRAYEAEPRIKMDLVEKDKEYMVKAEIPGVKKEDIKIDVNGSQVTISAETKREKEEKEGETVVRSERYYGQQYRSFTLAHDIDDEKVVARYQDGVLEIVLPKKAASVSKKITVS